MKNVLLDDVLREEGPLPLEIAWHWFGGMLEALARCHHAGGTHGDIKPAHIRLVDRGQVELIGEAPVPQAGFVSGTTLYMAPEMLVQGQSFDEYWKSRPKVIRKNVPRMHRKFLQEPDARIEIVTEPGDLDAALEAYWTVYRRRWTREEPFPEFVSTLARRRSNT